MATALALTLPEGQLILATSEVARLLGVAPKNALARASRENWDSTTRKGRGGGNAWIVNDKMPEETRSAIASALLRVSQTDTHALTPISLPAVSAEPQETSLERFNAKQRATAGARLALVQEVERLAAFVDGKGYVLFWSFYFIHCLFLYSQIQ